MHSSIGTSRRATQPELVATGKLKIAVQYRSKQSKVFELADGPLVLAVRISPRGDASDSGEWRVETRLGTGLIEPPISTGWGETPLDALRAAGKPTSGCPELAAFDWETVVAVLRAVQAV